MKTKELKTKTDVDLQKLIAENNKELSALRFRVQADNKDTKKVKNLKKDVARAKTFLTERKIK